MLAYGEHTDPMTSYRIELEMRIMEVVNDMIAAEGLIKGNDYRDPANEKFKELLANVKKGI